MNITAAANINKCGVHGLKLRFTGFEDVASFPCSSSVGLLLVLLIFPCSTVWVNPEPLVLHHKAEPGTLSIHC